MNIISKKEAKALGKLFYFTGKQCKRGHVDKRYVSTGDCYTCKMERGKKWYENNREDQLAKKAEWRKENPDYMKKWSEENKDYRRGYKKEYRRNNRESVNKQKRDSYYRNKEGIRKRAKFRYEENKETILQSQKLYYQENKKEILLKQKDYYRRNRDMYYAKAAERRAMKASRSYEIFSGEVLSIYKECRNINKKLASCVATDEISEAQYHVDHVIPLKSDFVCGLHTPNNLQIITAKENASKQNSFTPYWENHLTGEVHFG